MASEPPRPTRRVRLLTLLLLLTGCAVQGPPVRPTDFPFHASDQPPVSLHWRLDREDGTVKAVGLVELAVPDRITEVTLELQGLDKAGRVVSRGIDHARAMAFSGDVWWPFTIRLRPKGQEDRFALRVSDVTWKLLRGGS